MAFTLPELPYAYDALAPHIDAQTMEIHHSKHHQGYVNKLNAAVEEAELEGKSLEKLLKKASENAGIRNNGGGHYNHSLFWSILSPDGGGRPYGSLAKGIKESFGSFKLFKEEFAKAAATRFGSGWAWLGVRRKKLVICTTPNQDNPLMDVAECSCKPILGLDVWEHAYYLNYQNKRGEYINSFFEVVDWKKVRENYDVAMGLKK